MIVKKTRTIQNKKINKILKYLIKSIAIIFIASLVIYSLIYNFNNIFLKKDFVSFGGVSILTESDDTSMKPLIKNADLIITKKKRITNIQNDEIVAYYLNQKANNMAFDNRKENDELLNNAEERNNAFNDAEESSEKDGDEQSIKVQIVTNRVQENGKIYLITRGQNNLYPNQEEVVEDEIIGTVIIRIPFLGAIAKIFQSRYILVLYLIIIVVLIYYKYKAEMKKTIDK